jgi:hypothetical protein
MAKRVFSKDFLLNELDLPYSAIYKEIVDTSRWSIHNRCIFEHDGKFYEAFYSVGATESQDESPWEYDKDVECTEVELREVKVKKWVPVD